MFDGWRCGGDRDRRPSSTTTAPPTRTPSTAYLGGPFHCLGCLALASRVGLVGWCCFCWPNSSTSPGHLL